MPKDVKMPFHQWLGSELADEVVFVETPFNDGRAIIHTKGGRQFYMAYIKHEGDRITRTFTQIKIEEVE